MKSGTDYHSSGTPTWSKLAEVVGRNHINTRWIGISLFAGSQHHPLDFPSIDGLQHKSKT